MADCGCAGARRCACTVTAGPGVTVDGNGSASAPYIISADGGAGGTVAVQDGTCVSLDGDGTAGAPLTPGLILDPAPGNAATCGPNGLMVTFGAVTCDEVRPCFAAGDGAAYDPATGVFAARPSTDAGNTLGLGSDGGLMVPPTAPATVTTGCGLTGDGSATAPVTAATGTWSYACDVDTYAGNVYCDTAGALRTDPRSQATYTQDQINQQYPDTPVPPDDPAVLVESRTLTIVNPDPCREAFVICEVEVDVDFTLPPGATADYGVATDEMYSTTNSGSTTITDTHVQTTKVYNRMIPPGGTLNEPLDIIMGAGTNGATYNRIQSFMRAFVFNL